MPVGICTPCDNCSRSENADATVAIRGSSSGAAKTCNIYVVKAVPARNGSRGEEAGGRPRCQDSARSAAPTNESAIGAPDES